MQTISVVPDVQGNVRQIVTLFSDITALKQAEEALAESEEQRRLFIEYAPAGLAMFDRDMRYLYTSNRWFADHGLSKRDLYGLSHYDVFPEIPEEWKEAHRRGLAGEVLRSEGDRFERLDGSVKWMRWEIRPWYNAQRTIGGIVIFTEDITANKKAEEALRASEERLSLVLRGTQDGFWDWDLLRNKVHYSLRWWSMLGYAEGELEAAPDLWRRLTHPDDLERIDRDLAAALAGSTDTYEAEFRLRHREGHYLHIIARALILRDGQGQAIRVAGANRDVSENRRVENALREQEQFFRLITENLEGFVSRFSTSKGDEFTTVRPMRACWVTGIYPEPCLSRTFIRPTANESCRLVPRDRRDGNRAASRISLHDGRWRHLLARVAQWCHQRPGGPNQTRRRRLPRCHRAQGSRGSNPGSGLRGRVDPPSQPTDSQGPPEPDLGCQ
jgi:PAS domain S-box-containing protein